MGQFFFILNLKTKINFYNNILKNITQMQKKRSVINVFKTLFFNTNINRRFQFYLNHFIKLYVSKYVASYYEI